MTRPLAGQRKRPMPARRERPRAARFASELRSVSAAVRSAARCVEQPGLAGDARDARAARSGERGRRSACGWAAGVAPAGHGQHRAGAHPGRLGDAVDALQLGQRHAVLTRNAVERLTRLQRVAPLPAGRGHRRRRRAALRYRRCARAAPRDRRAAPARACAAGTPAGSTSCWPGLMAEPWARPLTSIRAEIGHAVALGDAVERVALLHLDGLAAGGRPRPIHRPAGIAVSAGGRFGCGLRRSVVARTGVALAAVGLGRVVGRRRRIGRWRRRGIGRRR